MDAETQTEEIKASKKKGRARMLTNLDPSLPFPEYRKIYQRMYYEANPRPKPPPKKIKLSEEEIRQKNLEYAKRYYEKHREKIILQIMEAQRRKKETKRLKEI